MNQDPLEPRQGSSKYHHSSLPLHTPSTTTTLSPPHLVPSSASARQSVTNFDLNSLIEQNNLSEDSCLLVIDNKVYDLTLCLQDHLSCNLDHNPSQAQSNTSHNNHHNNNSSPTSNSSSNPPSPPPSPLLQRSSGPSSNNINNTQIEPQPNRFDHLLQTAKRDPVHAGHLLRSIYQDQPFKTDGSPLQDWLFEYRIGDFNPCSASTPSTYLNQNYDSFIGPIDQDPFLSLSPSFLSSTSTDTVGPSNHRLNPVEETSHLDRANELVRVSKQRLIDAQRGVGIANLSLAEALAQLVEAEKVKDHLVLQASEGYKPIWGAWLPKNTR